MYSAPLQDPLVLLDLSPEEAQRYINQPPLQGPILAAKTATLPLVRIFYIRYMQITILMYLNDAFYYFRLNLTILDFDRVSLVPLTATIGRMELKSTILKTM